MSAESSRPTTDGPRPSDVPQRVPVPISIDDPRVYLAAERTLLAWVRTGVALIGLGFLVAKFGLFLRELTLMRRSNLPEPNLAPEPGALSSTATLPDWIGGLIVIVGAVLVLLAGLDHMRMVRRLGSDDFIGHRRRYLSGALTVVVATTGILLAGYLILL